MKAYSWIVTDKYEILNVRVASKQSCINCGISVHTGSKDPEFVDSLIKIVYDLDYLDCDYCLISEILKL